MEDIFRETPADRTKRSRSDTSSDCEDSVADWEGMSGPDGAPEVAEPAEVVEIGAEGQAAVDAVLGNSDILKMLFGRLDLRELSRLSGVCKYWKQIIQSDELWKDINFERSTSHPKQVLKILRKHPNATSVNLKGVDLDTFSASLVFHHMKRVTKLEIGAGYLMGDSLNEGSNVMTDLRTWIITAAYIGSTPNINLGSGPAIISQDFVQELIIEQCKAGHLTVRGKTLEVLSLRQSSLLNLQLSCPRLRSLSLDGCQSIPDFSLRNVITQLTQLTALDVSRMTHFSDDSLRQVGRSCTQLTHLIARDCDILLLTNIRGFPALKIADFSSCDALLPATMVHSIEGWTSLEELSLNSCKSLAQLNLTNVRLRTVSLQDCTALVQINLRCPSLERVVLDPPFSRSSKLRQIELSSAAIQRLTLCGISHLETIILDCPVLTSLDLSCCHLLEESVLANFGDASKQHDIPGFVSGRPALRPKCPSLRHLKLDNCSSLIVVDLKSSSLRKLSLAGCKNLQQLELVAPQLLELHLDECDQLKGINITPIAVEELSLGTCPKLLSLRANARSLLSLDLKLQCRGCGILKDLQLNCPSLERLDCAYCRSLPDQALSSICAAAPRLNSLVLSVCTAVGCSGLLELQNLRHLRMLDLSYTEIEVLDPVLEACTKLQTLKLHACCSLRPDALQPLLGGGPSGSPPALPMLKDLDISYCNRIPSSQLAELLLGARQLQVVAANGCEGMSGSVCEALHSGEAAGEVHFLQMLSAKTCRGLKAFWLGVHPPLQPEKKLPVCGMGAGLLSASSQLPRRWTPLAGLRVLKLALSGLRSLSLALPQLLLLDVGSCVELWRLHLECPSLQEAYFQSCRSLPTSVILEQLRGSPVLARLGLKQAELDDHLAEILTSWKHKLEIVPNAV